MRRSSGPTSPSGRKSSTARNSLAPAATKKRVLTRDVRKEGSGTTSLFKKFLGVVFPKEAEPGKTWKQLAESANNVVWPNEAGFP